MANKQKTKRSRSSSRNKKQPILGKNFQLNKKTGLLIAGVFAFLGALLILSANAATSSFEAEKAELSSGLSAAPDSQASNSKFVEFNRPITTTTNTQRFPGDPNPLVTGKAYWGATVARTSNGNDDPTTYHEQPTGKSLSVRRTFYGWNNNRTSMISTIKSDLANNRLPWVSTKTPKWAAVANGQHDAEIDDLLRKMDATGGPIWFTVYHEPEDNTNTGTGRESCEKKTPKTCDGTFAEWRAMQRKFRERMTAVGTKNIAFAPVIMSWTHDSRSNRDPNEYWVDGIWDFMGIDHYNEKPTSSIQDLTAWKNSVSFIKSKNIPYAIAEWGVAGNDSRAAAEMQSYWNWGFSNNQDLLGYAYFDSILNATAEGALKNQSLAKFHDILKNDSRVQRINELKQTTTTNTANNYGTITGEVSAPENGTYKLWVRMKAADANNNSVNVQIGDGNVAKLGGSKVSTTAWTWMAMPSVNLSSGNKTVVLTGTNKGVKVDRIILSNETCVPEGTGDKCATNPTQPPAPAPASAVTFTSITQDQKVSKTVPVTVKANFDIQAVSFRPDNTWAATVSATPFTYNWDTTKVANGIHTFTVRVRKVGDPGNVYTEQSINVNVQNATTTTPPKPVPVADTQAPTMPTNLRASLNTNWAKFKYEMALSWSPSSDNIGITGYKVAKNGEVIGTTKDTNYIDGSSLTSSSRYVYDISAVDAAGNTSKSSSISLQTSCFLIWCNVSVL